MPAPEPPMIFAHIGDLHITGADEQNHHDLRAIVGEIARELAGQIDFVYVPGDNADNGLPDQYALVRDALAGLPMPVHVITGDHDMEQGDLRAFYGALASERLPKRVDVAGVRCLFLDICGPGTGGPDFRIGGAQLEWLQHELGAARAADARCAVFMHTYPEDLRGPGEPQAVTAALADANVLLVDMGHTHYNELANDGRTVFAATRSTGQIEEGPVGYTLVAIDGRVVSWRFKELSATYPQVLVTAPADRRLATDADDGDHLQGACCAVRASVLGGTPVRRCVYRIDDGDVQPLPAIGPRRFGGDVAIPPSATRLTVEAEDDEGRVGAETIEIARREHLGGRRHADGSDKDAIGAWHERGIPGGQLGPNRNGRTW